MNFNFSTTAGASQSTFKPQLEGNKIYNVKFDGAEATELQGKKDPSMVYKVLKLKFSNDEGVFEHMIFEPRQEDAERRQSTTSSGETFENPSNIESMMLLLKHTIDAVVPNVGKQIDEGTANLSATGWDALRKKIVEILKPGIGTETKIKLVTDKNNNARFPGFFASLARETNKPYIRTNFIGEKVAFSSYEMDRINKAANAKPTDMKDDIMDFDVATPAEDTSLDLGFEVAEL